MRGRRTEKKMEHRVDLEFVASRLSELEEHNHHG